MGKPTAAAGTAARAAGPPRKKSIKITPSQREDGEEGPLNKHWRTYFLQKLAETSNIAASAGYAGISPSRAYKVRREDAGFATAWRAALYEGYDNLEMELLGHLRNPDPERKIDVASAMRLLVAHRERVARERAPREDDDEQAVLDSIDRFIDEMRDRRAANAAILIESERNDGED